MGAPFPNSSNPTFWLLDNFWEHLAKKIFSGPLKLAWSEIRIKKDREKSAIKVRGVKHVDGDQLENLQIVNLNFLIPFLGNFNRIIFVENWDWSISWFFLTLISYVFRCSKFIPGLFIFQYLRILFEQIWTSFWMVTLNFKNKIW